MGDGSKTAEVWRAIPGYEGLYEVSSQGRVRGLKRKKILSPFIDPAGRRNVHLYRDAKARPRRVHVLVAEAFIGPRPEGMVARHLDDNPANNCVSNLAWGTYRENGRDCVINGGHRQTLKTHCPQGHPYDGPNTIINHQGHRKCRTCARARANARRAAKRELTK